MEGRRPSGDSYIDYGFYPDELEEFSYLIEPESPHVNGKTGLQNPDFPKPPIIESIRDLQAINQHWRRMVGVEDEGIESIAPQFVGEVAELQEALEHGVNGNRAEVLSELADIGLYVFAMMSSLGARADEVLTAKIARNVYKYNPAKISEAMADGIPQNEAMQQAKSEWNRANDFHFFKDL